MSTFSKLITKQGLRNIESEIKEPAKIGILENGR